MAAMVLCDPVDTGGMKLVVDGCSELDDVSDDTVLVFGGDKSIVVVGAPDMLLPSA